MREALLAMPIEYWAAIIFGLALITAVIVRMVKDIRNSHSLGEDGLDEDEKFTDEKIEALHQAALWHCESCNAEFRIPSGAEPQICPSCGKQLVDESNRNVDDDAVPYICPQCGPYVMLDGDDSDTCPVCGSSDVEEASWVMRCPECWVCTDCSQEFITPNSAAPKMCPHCGELFVGRGGEVDEDGSEFVCPVCGEKVEMLDGEKMEYCPCCGKEFDT